MKIKHWLKRFLKDQRGMTMAELLVAMTIGGLVATAAIAIFVQMLLVTPRNTSYTAAFTQVQTAGDWISRDALMSQTTTPPATELSEFTSHGSPDIEVNDPTLFPPSGIIAIGDEIITYTSLDYGNREFKGCIWEPDSTSYVAGTTVTLDSLVYLEFTIARLTGEGDDEEMEYELHQAIYTLEGVSGELGEQKELWRNHYKIREEDGLPELQSSTRIAEYINEANTSSRWSGWVEGEEGEEGDGNFEVTITAQVGEKSATRTYEIKPRPMYYITGS